MSSKTRHIALSTALFTIIACWMCGSSSGASLCGSLTAAKYHLVGGHSEVCFHRKPVPFEVCRILLQKTDSCNALTYTDNVCSLHDRHSAVLTDRPVLHAVVLLKQIWDLDKCSGTHIFRSALDEFMKCKEQGSMEITSHLPLLGIVVSVTQNYLNENRAEIEAISRNWKCYASIHNYQFHLHVMPSMSNKYQFFQMRHEDIINNYLHLYQRLLILDGDNLAVNMSQSLNDVLQRPEDVILHMREGGEVAASSYFVRNTQYSRCFIRYWQNMGVPQHLQPINHWITTPNSDNGDLVAVVMSLISLEKMLRCTDFLQDRKLSDIYDMGMLRCFRVFRGALSDISHYSSNIFVYFIRENFLRIHTSHNDIISPSAHHTREYLLSIKNSACHPHDVVIHGWKALGVSYWQGMQCDVKVIVDKCVWLSDRDEQSIAMEFCYWRSPVCYGAEGNKCLSHGNCAMEIFNLQRWQYCYRYGICNPHLGPQAMLRIAQHRNISIDA